MPGARPGERCRTLRANKNTPGVGPPGCAGLDVLSVTGPLVEGGALAAGIRWTVAARDGGFTGSFTHPVTNRAQTFAGVVLQKTQRAGGFFRFVPATGSSVPAGVGAFYMAVP